MSQSTLPASHTLPESRLIVTLGCLDLLATVYLIATKQAAELNPLFVAIWGRFGSTGFVVFKALLMAVPVVILERARKHNEPFVRRALQIGVVLYALLLLSAYIPYLLRLGQGAMA